MVYLFKIKYLSNVRRMFKIEISTAGPYAGFDNTLHVASPQAVAALYETQEGVLIMRYGRKALLCGVVCCLVVLCSPQPIVRQGGEATPVCPPVSVTTPDSLSYTISFSNGEGQRQFIESFRSFISQYPFELLRQDTIAGQVLLRIAPFLPPDNGSARLATIEHASFDGSTIEHERSDSIHSGEFSPFPDVASAADTIRPLAGGKLRIYTQRMGMDETLLSLVAFNPLLPLDSSSQPLMAADRGASGKVTLQLHGRVSDARGRVVSALDMIEAWTAFVKRHPAEGFAMFRHVEGVREFIAGREAMIRGIVAKDRSSCTLRLAREDSLALDRLSDMRLSGSMYAKLGPYFPAGGDGGSRLTLAANPHSTPRRVYVDTVELIAGDDKNPILSFSLKKYDAVVLTLAADVEYARRNLGEQASLYPFSRERYFIACSMENDDGRRYLVSRIRSGEELLQNVVKVNGKPVASLHGDTGYADIPSVTPSAKPSMNRLRILYRRDDVVSVAIAEKLLADISGDNIGGELLGMDGAGYERALVEHEYECAVGWIDERSTFDAAGRLRLAAIWFDDDGDELRRIGSYREVPLFSVDRYLLMRKPAGVYRGGILGLYASSEPLSTE